MNDNVPAGAAAPTGAWPRDEPADAGRQGRPLPHRGTITTS